jgi:hypothetical protein
MLDPYPWWQNFHRLGRPVCAAISLRCMIYFVALIRCAIAHVVATHSRRLHPWVKCPKLVLTTFRLTYDASILWRNTPWCLGSRLTGSSTAITPQIVHRTFLSATITGPQGVGEYYTRYSSFYLRPFSVSVTGFYTTAPGSESRFASNFWC